ncbi:hypothetical protein N9A28_03750 [Sulfurimonas sp.]|nr:hypothetical protein [Sulfurimonas sp.]
MQKLIDTISKIVPSTRYFTFGLLQSSPVWKLKYPLAVIHSLHRSKTELTTIHFRELVDADGKTPNTYEDETLVKLGTNAAEAFQYADFIALKGDANPQIVFKEKNEKDFWKKIQNVDHIEATFDYTEFTSDEDASKVEFDLREIIRKRKEVHALKEVGFIWMAITESDSSKVFEHYFGENYKCIDNKYYIGWSDKLKDINMRYFVYTPE